METTSSTLFLPPSRPQTAITQYTLGISLLFRTSTGIVSSIFQLNSIDDFENIFEIMLITVLQ